MDSSERRSRIRANLGIEPISHGQVYTFQIAIPDSEQQNISLESRQIIEDSLNQHKSNLIPLIVRRTEAYTEEEEYELVYGADWCLIAKELDIEKLWVWVFDMTNEQAAAAKEEMQQLLSSDSHFGIDETQHTDIGKLIDQKITPIYTKLNQLVSATSQTKEKFNFDEKIITIENQLNQLLSKLEILIQKIDPPLPPKINLLTATHEEIEEKLKDAGMYSKQISAALEAVKYWLKSNQGLTWKNLDKSTKSGEYKIKSFGRETYQKLRKIAEIR
ncbi:hypothetical protein [Nostoc sp. TCL26-01]|uniref:hypothetical protein n=1 Tax=Nostoc sp. TCL26-01 TaxID=2576904 RepID=UPI0015BAFADF|nr:hypothetical protein [Nostoc sp. TCL26-01]QLE58550.1 hypothetical protein FD725_25410 [Nostoc sp. TCL26-01]